MVQWLGLCYFFFLLGPSVQSLVRELRSCNSCDVTKKEKEKKEKQKHLRLSWWLRLHLLMQLWVQSLIGKLRSHRPCSQKTKTGNRNNIVTNSIQTLKGVHIKKKTDKKESSEKGVETQSFFEYKIVGSP